MPPVSGYPEAIRKHFLEPRNAGEIPDASGVGEARNAACGDVLKLFLAVDREGRVERATFQARACSAVIAVASMTTEALVGSDVAAARALDVDALTREAGGLPTHKAHAPRVVRRALDAALDAAGS